MMKEAVQLLEDMHVRLAGITGLAEDDLTSIQEAIQIASEAIVQLRTIIVTGEFISTNDEIRFFKQIKPQFDGRLIFYLLLLRMQAMQVSVSPCDRHLEYARELKRLQSFYRQHYVFWQYYRMDQTHLDEHYFLRQTKDTLPLLEENQIHYDWQTNAPMSAIAAKIYAYELLRTHAAVVAAQFSLTSDSNKKTNDLPLHWTSSKAGLIELIYALQEYGVFNNAQLEVKKIADYFSIMFGIRFANVYKTYEDIRLRKKSRTPFLDALKAALERRIDRDNENAM